MVAETSRRPKTASFLLQKFLNTCRGTYFTGYFWQAMIGLTRAFLDKVLTDGGEAVDPRYTSKEFQMGKLRKQMALVEGYARAGYTNADIAKRFGIGTGRFDRYVDEEEDLQEALERGRQDTDILVENALLKRALGYSYKEVTKERKAVVDDDGEVRNRLVVTKVVKKDVQPDVQACLKWLERRNPQRWGENPMALEIEVVANEAILNMAELINHPVKTRKPEA